MDGAEWCGLRTNAIYLQWSQKKWNEGIADFGGFQLTKILKFQLEPLIRRVLWGFRGLRTSKVDDHLWIRLGSIKYDQLSMYLWCTTKGGSSRFGNHRVTTAQGRIVFIYQRFHFDLLHWPSGLMRVPQDQAGNDEAAGVMVAICSGILQTLATLICEINPLTTARSGWRLREVVFSFNWWFSL